MRRRSEKKSVDVSSPATTTPRRSRRSRKSPSPSESEKCVEPTEESGKVAAAAKGTTLDGDGAKAVAEERTVTTPARRGRRRTSVKERTVSPVAEKDREEEEPAASAKIAPIVEEENGNEEPIAAECGSTATEAATNDETESGTNTDRMDTQEVNVDEHVKVSVENEQVSAIEEEDNDNEKTTEAPIEAIVESSAIDNTTTATDTSQTDAKEAEDEVCARGASEERNEPAGSPRRDSREAEPEAGEQQQQQKEEAPVQDKTPAASNDTPPVTQEPVPSDETSSANHETHANDSESVRTRKRKWITKKTDNKAAVLAISTDSLKNLIADVQPVPLSDVKLDSSSEAEQAPSELEDGEETPSPDRRSDVEDERVREKPDEKERDRERRISLEASAQQQQQQQKAKRQGGKQNDVGSQQQNHHEKSPSPAHNVTSSILYITNLVRPFTVLQLKGLLARTGKIVEDGFWIDRIKSKCFVKYETEDEATETRHALHGVRWPVSNPKCLNVEFGLEADMQKAIDSTKEETTKTTQESQRENFIVGSGWNKERNDEDLKSKSARHVREWDVGKKENIDREKPRENEGRRSRDRDENERNGKDRKQPIRGRDPRSSSLSPVRKLKKIDEPPLRLLDDLFRKTKTTPCIYWLPLTPEQIAEKEAFRQKRIEEQKERLKQRELDKEREREKNRSDRGGGGGGGRGGDNRRNVSNERRRSRSRDRRRY